MPAYISHAIMMENLYSNYYNDNILFKIPLNINDLKTYSLGTDLSSISKTLKSNPHKNNTQVFFLFIINYIKANKLVNDSNVMSLLYGHIAHYFFDVSTHPFIYYIEKSYPNCSIISNHHLVEAYLDSYLSSKILKKDIMMINSSYFNKGHITKNSACLLDKTYSKIYYGKNISLIYKETLLLLTLLEKITKSGIFTKKMLYEISGLKKFIDNNNLSFNDLNNENFSLYRNPVSGEYSNKSFIELFYIAIYKTLNAINDVNKYLYGNKVLDDLNHVFIDLSYDTGLPCKEGSKMIYTKKKNL